MNNPKVIIELNANITNKQRDNITKGILSLLKITESDIKIFVANEYTFSSEFSQRVYEETRQDLANEYHHYGDENL